jgi:hypothetical protein
MFFSPTPRRRGPRDKRSVRSAQTRLVVEQLEDRCLLSGTVTITAIQGPSTTSTTVPEATEGQIANPSINAAFTDTNAVAPTPANLIVTIDYGDGTTASNQAGANFDANLIVTQVGGAGGKTYTVTDKHTFAEESGSTVPPFSFPMTLTVTEKANAANTDAAQATAQVVDAPLTDGDPVPIGPGTPTFGGNQGNATTAAQALANFEAAIGGAKNTAAAPQNGGFRVITWDGVKVDGTDNAAGANSTVVIKAGHTVGIPLNRFQGSGVFFGAVYAVSNDGFADVNPSVGPSPIFPNGLFPAFSPPNTFAMFNDNGIDFTFVPASSPFTGPVSAASRGFGAIFLNVQQPGTTITYFHGSTVIDTLNVPTNPTAGAAVFAGELFSSPIVTNVLLTLGNGAIFKFDGTTVTSGGVNTATNNLVAVDDWAFAEPVAITNGTNIPVSAPIGVAPGTLNAAVLVHATAGQAFTGVAATFSDADPNANAKDFTANINWGDGHSSNGTIVADGHNGFNVMGTNTYAAAGAFPIAVQIQDFGGSFFTVTNTASVAPSPPSPPAPPPPPVITGNLGFTGTPQGLLGLSGFLVQPLASNNQPVGPALTVPSLLSVFLTLDVAMVTSVSRDASGNVVIGVTFVGFPLALNYSSAGALVSATAFGISIPVSLL